MIIKNKLGRLFSTYLLVIMIINMLGINVSAEELGLPTTFYLDQGSIIIEGNTVNGYDSGGNPITTPNDNGYIITQTDPSIQMATFNTVQIAGDNPEIIFKNLNIQRLGYPSNFRYISITGKDVQDLTIDNVTISASKEAYYKGITPLYIDGASESNVNLTVKGENMFQAGKDRAGINVPHGAKLTITSESTGTLTAKGGYKDLGHGGGAGIGGNEGNGDSSFGDITINGGTITAIGMQGGAGIGSGSKDGMSYDAGTDWSMSTISINGGTVTAEVDSQRKQNPVPAYGIGKAGNARGCILNITGGCLKADSVQPVLNSKITGGSILIDGESCPIKDANGYDLYETEVTLKNIDQKTKITSLNIHGYDYGAGEIYTDDNGTIYLWLPHKDTDKEIEIHTNSKYYHGSITVGNSNTLEQIYTISFDSNGGDEVSRAFVKSGDKISKPEDPIKKGYDFEGWYKDSELTNLWNFEDIPTQDITLYAKWTRYPYLDDITMTVSPETVEYNHDFSKEFTLSIYKDTVAKDVYAEDFALSGVFTNFNVKNISYTDTTVTSTVYGTLENSGEGVITFYPNKLSNSIKPLSASITVLPQPTYTITYSGNGSTSGAVPTDINKYVKGEEIVVQGNVSGLGKQKYKFVGWNTKEDGSGKKYIPNDTLIIGDNNIILYAMWEKVPEDNEDEPSDSNDSRSDSKESTKTTPDASAALNGKNGKIKVDVHTDENKQKIIQVIPDKEALNQEMKDILNSSNNETSKQIRIELNNQEADRVEIQLSGDILKQMIQNDFEIIIHTELGDYIIPAKAIYLAKVTNQLGIGLEDLGEAEFKISISKISEEKQKEIITKGNDQGYDILAVPTAFEITAYTKDSTSKEVKVSPYELYVERRIRISKGVEPNEIAAGVVYDTDGSFSHVPAKIIEVNGVKYIAMDSLTDSIYTAIGNTVSIQDSVEQHWSKDAYVNMASKLIISESDPFMPDEAITRGEFAEYITKALGIYRSGITQEKQFKDLAITDELSDAITIASEYGIINGYEDGTFKPNAQISRQEAMVMYARAMNVVNLNQEENNKIENYKDKTKVAPWAYDAVKTTLNAGVFNGRTKDTIAPRGTMTNAEAVTAISNLLIKAQLINE